MGKIKIDQLKRNTGLFAGMSLAILSTTCCALPIILVSIGLGGAMASLVSNAPWLIELSKHKVWTFSITTLILAYCWYLLFKLKENTKTEGANCNIESQRMIKWQKRMLWFSSILLIISIMAAYVWLPVRMWIDNQ